MIKGLKINDKDDLVGLLNLANLLSDSPVDNPEFDDSQFNELEELNERINELSGELEENMHVLSEEFFRK